jgi:hypothetical protein
MLMTRELSRRENPRTPFVRSHLDNDCEDHKNYYLAVSRVKSTGEPSFHWIEPEHPFSKETRNQRSTPDVLSMLMHHHPLVRPRTRCLHWTNESPNFKLLACWLLQLYGDPSSQIVATKRTFWMTKNVQRDNLHRLCQRFSSKYFTRNDRRVGLVRHYSLALIEISK